MKYAIILWLLFQDVSPHDNLKGRVALSGYDAVSYFESAGPRKGDKSIQSSYDGATYYFSNKAHRDAFDEEPEKYIPKYGGWCAYAMGVSGDKVKVDPETFKIIDDKLYLFYNFWGNNTLDPWNSNESALQTKADNYWDQIVTTK